MDILTLKNPFDHLHRDEDVEALSDGFDKQTAYGEVWGVKGEVWGPGRRSVCSPQYALIEILRLALLNTLPLS